MDIGLKYQILPDTQINFAVLNVTDRKSEDIDTIMVTGRSMKDAVIGLM